MWNSLSVKYAMFKAHNGSRSGMVGHHLSQQGVSGGGGGLLCNQCVVGYVKLSRYGKGTVL